MVSTIHTSLLVWFNAILVYYIYCFNNVLAAKILLWCVFFFFYLHLFFQKQEISDRIKQKMAFVFIIIQVKAIDTTSGVTATDGLHSNFLIGIANIDSLPTATMVLSISLSLPCPISRSQVFTLQSYDKRKPASTTWRLFLIFCLSSR